MSFWTTSAGHVATGEVEDNDFGAPVAKGSYKAILEEVKTQDFQGDRSIQLKARILEGAAKNRVLFLKINAWAAEDKKRDRAINLLVQCANIVGVALPNAEPDDVWLSKLIDKPLMLGVDVWEMEIKGEQRQGNFLTKFEACGKSIKPATKPVAKKAEQQRVEDVEEVYEAGADEDVDIPF